MAAEIDTSTIGKLTATVRTDTGKGLARKLRQNGLIPAVVYGKTEQSIPLTVDPVALKSALDPSKRKNTVITLTIDDSGKTQQTMVMLKDYQIDTLKQVVLHADFVRVAEDQLVDVQVPLLLEGKPEGVKIGGNLHQVFRTLPVKCTPDKIPASLSIDVSDLELNESKQLKELEIPEGIEIALPLSQTIALVMAPKAVAEEEEVEAAEGEEGEGEEGEGAEGEAKEGEPAKAADSGKPGAGKPGKG